MMWRWDGAVTVLRWSCFVGPSRVCSCWLHTELSRSRDPLAESYDQCLSNARALIGFCRRLGLPFGINVESLTNRKVEIEASVDLAREIRELLR